MATKKKLTTVVIDALEDIKARDIKLINVAKLTSVFDYIAIASADSTRQTKALANNVMDKVREHGAWIYGIEGEQSGEWVLVDCGDVVVHIMQPAVREHYKLEELWSEGRLEFPKPVAAKRKAVAPKAPVKSTAGTKVSSRKSPKVAPLGTKLKTIKPSVTRRKTAKNATAVATAKVGKKRKTLAKAKVVTRKVAAKGVTTVRKKAVATKVKPPVVKKIAAKKPVGRRRKTGTE